MSWKVSPTMAWNESIWNPSMIQTALWLDGSDNTTIFSDAGITRATNGAAVQQWNDKSGNNRHVTQATAGNCPSFTTNSLNGRSGITFADASRWLLGAVADESAFDYTSTLYLFFVGNIASNSQDNVFINKGRGTFGAIGWYASISTGGASITGVTSSASVSGLSTSSIPENSSLILSWEINGATVRARKNGTTDSTTVVGKASWIAGVNNETLAIGAYVTSSVTSNYQGVMQQIILMSSVPTFETVQKLEGWAAHYYGLESNLPNDHPYKTVGPTP